MLATSAIADRPGLTAADLDELPEEPWLARPFTWIGAAFDGLVVAAAQAVVSRALLSGDGDLAAIRRSAEPYLADREGDPADFFATPSLAGEIAAVRVAEQVVGTLPGGRIVDRLIDCDTGDPLPVEHWIHDHAGDRPTMIALHGFAMGRRRLDTVALQARTWFDLGLDVAMITLPFHGSRTPHGARFSGEPFASPDVGALNLAVRRAVHELRVLIALLRHEGNGPVGALGVSLGGYLVALLASLDADLDFAVPIVPPVCIGDLAWRFYAPREAGNGTAGEAAGGATGGLSRAELRACYGLHSPLRHALRVPRERVLIVAGRGDRIVPPEHPHALWRHWDRPAIHWYSGSHLAPFGRRSIADAVGDHLARLNLA